MPERPPTDADAQPSRRRTDAALTLALTALVTFAAVAAPVAAAGAFTPAEESTTLYPAADQTVRGQTSLDPGTELLVYVRSNRGDYRFSKRARANVTEDGTYAAAFDLSGLPENVSTSANVTVRHATNPDGPKTTYPVELRPASERPETATATDSSETAVPGFSPVTAAVGAAVAALLFARRD